MIVGVKDVDSSRDVKSVTYLQIKRILRVLLMGIPVLLSNDVTQALGQAEGLRLTVRVEKVTVKKVVLRTIIRNETNEVLFVTANPVRLNGEKGPYLSFDSIGQILRVETRVFGLDRPPAYSDETRVEVRSLAPNQVIQEDITLLHNQLESVPPVKLHQNRKRIDLTKLKSIQIRYGYFLDETGIGNILARKVYGPWINGLERVRSVGKTTHLFEHQNFLSENVEFKTDLPVSANSPTGQVRMSDLDSCRCPATKIEAGSLVAGYGETVTFEVVIVDPKLKKCDLTYDWLASNGKIVAGQKTKRIRLRVPKESVGTTITVAASVNGERGCEGTPSETIEIKPG